MIETRVLQNGIRVVMEQMPHLRTTSIGIWVRTGAVCEDPRCAGISHFVEHMMFKGTPDRDAAKIAADVEALGAEMNAFTDKEATCYHVKALTANWKPAADVLCDMLEHSLFDPEEMDRERAVICEEIKMDEDASDDLAHDRLVELLFRGEPLAHSITGNATTLRRITRRVMKEYVRRHYVRSAIVVSAAGSFDPDELCAYFEKQFTELAADGPAAVQGTAPYVPGFSNKRKEIQQTHICLGTRAIPLQDDRSYALAILGNILGGGMSSRLFQKIREERGLAYTVFADSDSFSRIGYFEIYAAVSHANLRPAVLAVRDEIGRLAKAPVTREELDSSRVQMKAGYVFSGESTSARMLANGRNYLLLNRVFTPEEVLSSYDAVTIDDIEAIKDMLCDWDSYSASVVSGARTDIRRIMQS